MSKNMFRGKVRQIHFVGIGGIGMSGIAEVLLNLGYRVSGSDLRAGASVQRLRSMGAEVAIGHDPANLGGSDVVVRSTAVKDDNPEVAAAHIRGVPVIPRAEMLAELMRMKHGLAVAGTHGKTTTTSMLAQVLAAAGLDPTVVIGGRVDAFGSNARLGQGEFLVAEADESDGSFMLLAPTAAVITNIDPEHMEHYGDFEQLVETFLAFANKVPFYGFTVACIDHPVVASLVPRMTRRVISYGLSREAEVWAGDVRTRGLNTGFVVYRGERALGRIELGMPGHHNVQNALAAVVCALELDIPFAAIQSGLAGFTGVQRRFTVRGEAAGVMVIDDYGHHPVEIQATLTAAREAFPERRLIAVFQPHRYSRVRDLYVDFCRAFTRAHHVVVCPIYAAGERPIPELQDMAAGLTAYGHRSVFRADDLDAAGAHLAEQARSGDLVITLGAGNVNQLCVPLLASLGDREGAE